MCPLHLLFSLVSAGYSRFHQRRSQWPLRSLSLLVRLISPSANRQRNSRAMPPPVTTGMQERRVIYPSAASYVDRSCREMPSSSPCPTTQHPLLGRPRYGSPRSPQYQHVEGAVQQVGAGVGREEWSVIG